MAQNKKHITSDNIAEWLSSTGFLFPRNDLELKRFEILYGGADFGLTGKEIDPNEILEGTFRNKIEAKIPDDINQNEVMTYRMAARKGESLPQHILNKIMKNQNKLKDDSSGQESNDK